MTVEVYRQRLFQLQDSVVRLGRQTALAALMAPTWQAKAEATAQVVEILRAADDIEEFLQRHYAEPPCFVQWPTGWVLSDRGLRDDVVDRNETEAAIVAVAQSVSWQLDQLLSESSLGVLHIPERHLAERVADQLELPSQRVEQSATTVDKLGGGIGTPRQAVRGPKSVPIDPAFRLTRSLLHELPPSFGDRLEQAVPYFWNLSTREATAADLCLLSLIEYDGFPLAFYRDMAKQACDESRHAIYFLEEARRLLPDLRASLSDDDELARELDSDDRLPIPAEGRLYEAIWNMDLAERLVLMHHDTETPAIAELADWIASPFCQRHPQVAEAFDVIRRDEISHSRIGNIWFHTLLPEASDRRAALARARLLRGFFLVLGIASHSDQSLEDLALEARTATPA